MAKLTTYNFVSKRDAIDHFRAQLTPGMWIHQWGTWSPEGDPTGATCWDKGITIGSAPVWGCDYQWRGDEDDVTLGWFVSQNQLNDNRWELLLGPRK